MYLHLLKTNKNNQHIRDIYNDKKNIIKSLSNKVKIIMSILHFYADQIKKKTLSVNQSLITPNIRNNPSWHCQTCNCKHVCCEEQSAGNDTQSIHFDFRITCSLFFRVVGYLIIRTRMKTFKVTRTTCLL